MKGCLVRMSLLRRRTAVAGAGLLLLTTVADTGQPPQTLAATNFADPAFQSTWMRTDALVANGQVKRSWMWGPQPNSGALSEDYAEGVNGKRLVQYFDKARMEINNPNGDKSDLFYVTNGLLTVELITGYMQTGNNTRVLRWPAEIPLAGDTNVDTDTGPTYASFRGAIARNDEKKSGQIVDGEIGNDGSLYLENDGSVPTRLVAYDVHYTYYEAATGHNIPDVFWSFLNATGPVVSGGEQVTARLSDPYFYATGYPISDAYWAVSTVDGKSVDVLIQPFQRRVLTYIPSAPDGFKVQMGNVGQHYYDWRYNDAGKPLVLRGLCDDSPTLGFGKVYNDNPSVKITLGCAEGAEFRVTVTKQTFEHGVMLGEYLNNYYSNQYYEEVHVLFDDNTARSYHFFPLDEAAGTPPPTGSIGAYNSTSYFGNVWSQNGDVEAKLGNPTGDFSTMPADGAVGVPVQFFTGGFMIYPDLASRQIYVLFNSSGQGYVRDVPHLQFADVDQWAAYADTYQP